MRFTIDLFTAVLRQQGVPGVLILAGYLALSVGAVVWLLVSMLGAAVRKWRRRQLRIELQLLRGGRPPLFTFYPEQQYIRRGNCRLGSSVSLLRQGGVLSPELAVWLALCAGLALAGIVVYVASGERRPLNGVVSKAEIRSVRSVGHVFVVDRSSGVQLPFATRNGIKLALSGDWLTRADDDDRLDSWANHHPTQLPALRFSGLVFLGYLGPTENVGSNCCGSGGCRPCVRQFDQDVRNLADFKWPRQCDAFDGQPRTALVPSGLLCLLERRISEFQLVLGPTILGAQPIILRLRIAVGLALRDTRQPIRFTRFIKRSFGLSRLLNQEGNADYRGNGSDTFETEREPISPGVALVAGTMLLFGAWASAAYGWFWVHSRQWGRALVAFVLAVLMCFGGFHLCIRS